MATKHIEKMFNEKRYADCRNYCDWAFGDNPTLFNPDALPEDFRCMAVSTFLTGDILRAKPLLEQLLAMPQYAGDAELRGMLDTASQAAPSRIPIICENEVITPEIARLITMLERLTHVFSGIQKPIRVLVPDSKEAYEQAYRNHWATGNIYAYESFMACGFGGVDIPFHWLVFKPQHISFAYPDAALEGMISHELCHREMSDTLLYQTMIQLMPDLRKLEYNERLTDLRIMEHGLAYPLYRSRLHYGASRVVIQAAEIIGYLSKLQQ